jgi:hypothetical protein
VVPALIVSAVVVLGLVAWLWASRSALSTTRVQVSELSDRLAAVTREAEVAAADAAEARARAETEQARAVEADHRAGQAEEQLAAAAARTDQQVAAATTRAEQAETAAEEACAALAGLRARAEFDPLGLWALETVRFDRMWRDQLAPDPSDDSPLAATTDPARAAVEIVISTLREQSGTSVELRWELDRTLGPGPAAWLVRATEELLTSIARAADSASLGVTFDEDGTSVSISLRGEPSLRAPGHLAAAFDAAGLVLSDDDGHITVRLPAGGSTGWETDGTES